MIWVSIVSGSAPASVVVTVDQREADARDDRHAERQIRVDAEQGQRHRQRRDDQRVANGELGDVHASARQPPLSVAGGAARQSSVGPAATIDSPSDSVMDPGKMTVSPAWTPLVIWMADALLSPMLTICILARPIDRGEDELLAAALLQRRGGHDDRVLGVCSLDHDSVDIPARSLPSGLFGTTCTLAVRLLVSSVGLMALIVPSNGWPRERGDVELDRLALGKLAELALFGVDHHLERRRHQRHQRRGRADQRPRRDLEIA